MSYYEGIFGPGACRGRLCRDGEGERKAAPPHTCPILVEYKDDLETTCTCCDECRAECAADV